MPTVTKAQQKAYAAKLRQISRNFDTLERETLEQSIRLLRQVRNSIAGQLTDTDFNQFRIAEQQAAIDDIIGQYENQARAMTNGAVRQSVTLGEMSAVEPLQALGIDGAFFQPSTTQVQVLTQFSADMIQDVGQTALRKINRSIRMNALAGNSQLDAMRDITNILFGTSRPPSPTTKRPTKGVAYEAERILRTETNRAYNLAAFSQQEQLARDVPELQKQWVATGDARTRDSHLAVHGQIRDMDKQFSNGLMYPGDPAGPAHETINCRCRQVSYLPGIDDETLANQAEIDEELAARDKEKARKARAKMTVADEIALIDKGSLDPFSAIRPPSGRAPRGSGQEYKIRRGIVSKIETQMKYRGQAEKQLEQYRGQKGTRNRWRIDVAKERVRQLNKGISAALDIASETITDDWIFKGELVDGIFSQVSALRT